MGVAPAKQNILTRCGVGVGAPADTMYVGWYHRFLALFGLLALAVIAGVSFDSSVSTGQSSVVVVTVVAMMLWFWFFGQWQQIQSDLHAVIYLLGNVIGITICIRIWDSSALMLFAIYWFGFAYLYTRYAIVYAFVLTISTQWAFGALGSNLGFNLDTLIAAGLLIVLLGFSAMMARYIEAFQVEAERNKALVTELKRTQQSLIEREREAGIEQERRRMAGEIHDTIAQHFASVITNLRAAHELSDANADTSRQHLNHAFLAAQQGLADSRALLSTMQPDVLLGRSLTDTIQSILEEWSGTSSAVTSFDHDGAPAQLSRAQEAILVRALQESLRNIEKHANASKVVVTLTWLEDEMLMDITDTGRGFDPESIDAGANGYKLGLITMQSRIESAGGTFALESATGEGTSVTVSFPTGGAS